MDPSRETTQGDLNRDGPNAPGGAYGKEVAALKQQLALLQAGVDTEHELAPLFVQKFAQDGKEWTPEAVRAAAEPYAKYGLVKDRSPQGADGRGRDRTARGRGRARGR
jgi:hypothetical protein